MDVDSDLDSQLLQQLRCMGTQDRDVLVQDFKRLLGNQLSDQCCTFYLDMANWNLQEAVNAYCDFEQSSASYGMSLVRDISVGDGLEVSPSTKFFKTWRIRNSGRDPWPPACHLRHVQGAKLGTQDRVLVDPLQPGQEVDIVHQLESPAQCGLYQSQWRMSTPTGAFFGEPVWVIIQVTEDGLLGVTQQLSRIGSNTQASPPPRIVKNPFERSNPFETPNSLNTTGSECLTVPSRPAGDAGFMQASSVPSELPGPLGSSIAPSRSDPDLSSMNSGLLNMGSPSPSPDVTNQFPCFGNSPGLNGHSNGIDDDEEML